MMMRRNGSSAAERKRIPRATVRRVMSTFAPYRWYLAGIALLVLASAGLGILTPFYLQALINDGLEKGNLSVITHYTILSLVVTIAATALALGYNYLSMT